MVAVLVLAVVLARPWEASVPPMRAAVPPEDLRSVSVDFGIVADPDTDWSSIDQHLDRAGVNAVELNAGRVEYTAFDWDDHPDAAAEPGTDHLAVAARALGQGPDGARRDVGLIVDAYVPRWLEQDPSLAGRSPDGQPAEYQASASALAKGPVGDRLVDYVVELGRRYEPAQISVTELFLDRYTFGDDDLALYREMTGAQDWPRDESGAVEEDAPALGSWRSDVLAGLLTRMRTGLDEVQRGDTARVALSMEVRVDWDDLARGVPSSGHDYEVLLTAVDRLTVWAYFQPSGRDVSSVEALTAALAGAGFDMSRITVSVGLWAGSSASTARISPEVMARAATLAATNGVRAVNVTPLSFMTDEHWSALASVWHPDAGEDETP
ncbi:hypothetical protein GYH36_03650 [Cellulosimicrobium cellulans]|uniref:Glycosyl hydrolase-like 10 domain-containing protein n=1 Tax=Cellulosimicrobium composti TaxID=2672572 RepID=A0ABX0BC81_9MICO|nr:hypothetical protein [Cellulosimicrobium composti]